MILVFDTSALIKRYIAESDSDRVNAVWTTADLLCASWVTEAEMLATFARKRREGILDLPALDTAESCFRADWSTFTRVEPFRISHLLLGLHRAYPLRGADSIHLATALLLRGLLPDNQVVFATADERLIKSAITEGIAVIP